MMFAGRTDKNLPLLSVKNRPLFRKDLINPLVELPRMIPIYDRSLLSSEPEDFFLEFPAGLQRSRNAHHEGLTGACVTL
jgi:hypothetical protein